MDSSLKTVAIRYIWKAEKRKETLMINFNVPPFTGKEMDYIRQAVENQKICGDGEFTKKCSQWIEERTGTAKCLLTTSCTHATELAALLTGVGPGDEVIMPSYTFVSTADAFVLRGATPVFVDIRPDTMNMDEKLIEDAVTEKTRGIVPVHYAGVGCEMDEIMDIARRHHLFVVEDAAQCIPIRISIKALGTIGDFGCFSFHETKNVSCGEGGALLIAHEKDIGERGDFPGKGGRTGASISAARWTSTAGQNYGSSYLPSELNAAYLYAQLELADQITAARLSIWNQYREELSCLEQAA